jgi:hypothetical protein
MNLWVEEKVFTPSLCAFFADYLANMSGDMPYLFQCDGSSRLTQSSADAAIVNFRAHGNPNLGAVDALGQRQCEASAHQSG